MAEPLHSIPKSIAALLGTLPMSLGVSIALASSLPLTAAARALVAVYAVVPLWLLNVCLSFLAPSASRAWWSIAAVSMIAALVAFVFGRGMS